MDTDEHGHGTGIASTLVAPCCGIAKKATLIDVRILNENNHGNVADVILALQYVYQNQGGPVSGRPWPHQPAVIK